MDWRRRVIRIGLVVAGFCLCTTLGAITISPSKATVSEGATQQFTAKSATWKTSCGSISSGGLFQAPLFPGTCTATATSKRDGTNATATITVTSPIVVTPVTATTPQGQTQQFTANVPVRWVAKCGTISVSGLFTATSPPGTYCTVEAIASSGTAYTAYGSDQSTTGAANFTIAPLNPQLNAGATLQFTASSAATWTASCGAISTSGFYTAPASAGTCNIAATSSTSQTASTVATIAQSPPTGTALTACGPITRSGSYYLANDVSSSGTCFTLAADNIVLDLNRHTATYGSGGGQSFGVQIDSQSASSFGSTVTNGHLVQSSSAAPASHVFQYGYPGGWGSNNGHINEVISNITADIYTQDSGFFWSTYGGGNDVIHNVTVNNHNTNVSNRDQLLGYAIHIDTGNTSTPLPDQFYNIVINGGPQGGIYSNGSMIAHDNQFHLGPTEYVGGYCVFLSGLNNEVYNTTCDGNTRGFEIEGKGDYLHDSVVNVTDSALVHDPGHNPDGCEIDGAYGIRVKSYNTSGYLSQPNNARIDKLKVTVNAGACPAQALRFTAIIAGETMSVTNSEFTQVGTSSAGNSSALSVNGDSDLGIAGDYTGVTFSGNTWTAGDKLVYAPWDGSSNLNLSGTYQGSQTLEYVCGAAACRNNSILGNLPQPVLKCDPNNLGVDVSVNGIHLSCT